MTQPDRQAMMVNCEALMNEIDSANKGLPIRNIIDAIILDARFWNLKGDEQIIFLLLLSAKLQT